MLAVIILSRALASQCIPCSLTSATACVQRWNLDTTKVLAESHRQAIDWVAKVCAEACTAQLTPSVLGVPPHAKVCRLALPCILQQTCLRCSACFISLWSPAYQIHARAVCGGQHSVCPFFCIEFSLNVVCGLWGKVLSNVAHDLSEGPALTQLVVNVEG